MSEPTDSRTTEFALGERLAFLERHVQQQDREMYSQSELIRRLQREVTELREQLQGVKARGEEQADLPVDERPPHY